MAAIGDKADFHNLKTEEEVFEITDFTNSSDWEKFISKVEEIISDWHLTDYIRLQSLSENVLSVNEWETRSANLSFTGVPFVMTLHHLKEKEDVEQFVDENNDDDNERLQLPQYVEDMMNTNNDFPPRAHCLARWFGLRSFLVLSIATGNGIASESKSNLLLSSVAIALRNTSCDVPFFVQMQENWRRMYAGHAVSNGISTEFEMVHLKKIPTQYHHLSGLMSVFKSKIGLNSVMSGNTRVSARFTFVLNDWGLDGKWPTNPPDSEALASHYGSLMCGCYEDPVGELQLAATWPSMIGDMVIDNDIHSYFKPLTAPCWSIRLRYTDDVFYLLSSYLFEFIKITDRNESMNDLLNILHDDPERHMGQALSKITDSQNTVIPIVPVKLTSGITKVVTGPQSLLIKGAHTLGRIAAVRDRMAREVLVDIKHFLFAECDSTDNTSSSLQSGSSVSYGLFHKLKAAPVGSLTYRVALCAIVVNMCHGGLSAVAQLWHLFVSELRTLLDSGQPLPCVDGQLPDLKTCLLHQKLQMLNYCINCKRQRESAKHKTSSIKQAGDSTSSFQTAFNDQFDRSNNQESFNESATSLSDAAFSDATALNTSSSALACEQMEESYESSHSERNISTLLNSSKRVGSFNSDSDDEFFECKSGDEFVSDNTDQADDAGRENEGDANYHDRPSVENSASLSHQIDAFNEIDESYSAEGRLSICENLKLLHFDKPLYIPVTQEHPAMTEDLLEEQAEVFSKLGDTQEGSKVRAKMQSASLLSDMQAFKAANPGCCLEDFLRWYSPKDFENGKLSDRMLIPNNLWMTLWASAKPIPITRQKRLFDDTKEAERVLHFLANLKPSEVSQMVIPVCIHEALVSIRLVSESMANCLPSLPLICGQIEAKASRLFRSWRMHGCVSNQFQPWSDATRSAVNDILTQISFAESLIERSRSLRQKFSALGSEEEVSSFVRKLLEHPEVTLHDAADGKQGRIVRDYFQNQQNKIRSAQSQENRPEEFTKTPTECLPDPTGREFIIRSTHPYPTSGSRDLPHRFYAVLMRNEFRLATAVSSDSTFF